MNLMLFAICLFLLLGLVTRQFGGRLFLSVTAVAVGLMALYFVNDGLM